MRIPEIVDKLDDKELAILEAVSEGAGDVLEIRQATTLSNSAVNYRVNEKATLEDLGLVTVRRIGGRVKREVDGYKKEMDAPKQVDITDLGMAVIEEAEDMTRFKGLTDAERVEMLRSMRKELDELQTQVSILQRELREQG